MKKVLIIGITLLIICLGLTVYKEFDCVNIHDITNSGLKTENKSVYLDVTYVAGIISSDSDNSFYVMFGDGVQYIVYMDNNEARKINTYLLDNPDNSYHIVGKTKIIPSNLEENGKKFVKEWLDNNHSHATGEEHSHEITTEEFYHYFGYVYFDSVNYSNILKIIIYFTGIIGTILVLSFVTKKYRIF